MRFSVYIVCPSVLNCSNLKLHQTSEVKNIFKQEKIMLQLTFNPGLMLTGFRTTRPRITSIFRKEDIPVRVVHKSYTLRRALSHNNKERTCTRANCPISGTKLCLVRNAVYQITCNNCNQHYIGSTIRFIHDRVREHLNNDNSSVKKHLSQCQNKVYKGIEIKSIVLENDPANLRLLEAFYIRKYKPTMNSREECSEFADLLF